MRRVVSQVRLLLGISMRCMSRISKCNCRYKGNASHPAGNSSHEHQSIYVAITEFLVRIAIDKVARVQM